MATIKMNDFSIFDLKNQMTYSLSRKLYGEDCDLNNSIDINPSEYDISHEHGLVSCIVEISDLDINVKGFPFKKASVSFEVVLAGIEWQKGSPAWGGKWGVDAELYNHSLGFTGSDDDQKYYNGDSYDEDYGFFHEDDDKQLNNMIVEACLLHLTPEAEKRFTSLVWEEVKKYATTAAQ